MDFTENIGIMALQRAWRDKIDHFEIDRAGILSIDEVVEIANIRAMSDANLRQTNELLEAMGEASSYKEIRCSVLNCANDPHWVIEERLLCDFCLMDLGQRGATWEQLKRELGARPLINGKVPETYPGMEHGYEDCNDDCQPA